MRPSRPARLALLALVCLSALAGCGSTGTGGGSSDPDPAKAVGAGVPFYLETVVRPTSGQADDVSALIKKVGGIEDPQAEIDAYLERSSKRDGGPSVSFQEDIKPWLGKRLGFGVSGIEGDKPTFVAAAGVTDTDKAKTFVKEQSTGDAKGTYEDVTYYEDTKDETVVGVAGDYLVLTERLPQFKAAVDQIAKDKGSLADADAYKNAIGDLPGDRLASFYVNTTTVKELLKRDPNVASSGGAAVVEQVFGGIKGVSGALTAAEDRATLETRVLTDGSAGTLSLFGPGVAPALVREAPADALFVYGIKDVGGTARTALQSAAGGLGGAALQGQLRSALGIDLDRDVFSWIGDVALFGRGSDLATFDGALMIDAKDVDAAKAALPRLVGLARQRAGIALDPVSLGGADQAFSTSIPGAPAPLFVARKGGRVVLALGEDATRAGLQPSSTIDANGTYDRAKQATQGYDPSLIVDVQRVVDLAEKAAAGDADLQRAKPYLDALSLLAAGAKQEGDTYVSRVALTVE